MLKYKTLVSACMLLIVVASQSALALVACDNGQIALGTIFVHITIQNEAGIFDAACNSLDFKSGGTDDSLCGGYSDGSSVTCDASGVPEIGVLSNGTIFGDCVANQHDCDNINKVLFCCSLE